MAYAVTLDQFEGPLDLLLYLISKNKINISDIPIAQITGQYLLYIHRWQELDMDIASEFILMASRLLEIKSRTLLPRQPEEVDEEDLRETLVSQLIDYQVFKSISGYLENRELEGAGAFYKEPDYIPERPQEITLDVTPTDLAKAFKNVIAMYHDDNVIKQYPGEIVRDNHTIEEKINLIRERFAQNPKEDIHFSQLLSGKQRKAEVVVTFQALLEMYKISGVQLLQKGIFEEITIRQGP